MAPTRHVNSATSRVNSKSISAPMPLQSKLQLLGLSEPRVRLGVRRCHQCWEISKSITTTLYWTFLIVHKYNCLVCSLSTLWLLSVIERWRLTTLDKLELDEQTNEWTNIDQHLLNSCRNSRSSLSCKIFVNDLRLKNIIFSIQLSDILKEGKDNGVLLTG